MRKCCQGCYYSGNNAYEEPCNACSYGITNSDVCFYISENADYKKKCGNCKYFKDEDTSGKGWCEKHKTVFSCGALCTGWEDVCDINGGNNDKIKNEMTDKISNICKMIEQTLISKNTDYGNSFQETLCKYGDVALMVRLSDKFARLDRLYRGKQQLVKDENFNDTLKDLAGYCLLYLAIKEDENE